MPLLPPAHTLTRRHLAVVNLLGATLPDRKLVKVSLRLDCSADCSCSLAVLAEGARLTLAPPADRTLGVLRRQPPHLGAHHGPPPVPRPDARPGPQRAPAQRPLGPPLGTRRRPSPLDPSPPLLPLVLVLVLVRIRIHLGLLLDRPSRTRPSASECRPAPEPRPRGGPQARAPRRHRAPPHRRHPQGPPARHGPPRARSAQPHQRQDSQEAQPHRAQGLLDGRRGGLCGSRVRPVSSMPLAGSAASCRGPAAR